MIRFSEEAVDVNHKTRTSKSIGIQSPIAGFQSIIFDIEPRVIALENADNKDDFDSLHYLLKRPDRLDDGLTNLSRKIDTLRLYQLLDHFDKTMVTPRPSRTPLKDRNGGQHNNPVDPDDDTIFIRVTQTPGSHLFEWNRLRTSC